MSNGYDQENFSDQKLKTGYWYVTHKDLLKRILIGALIFINVIFWGFTLYRLVDLYILSYDQYKALVNDLPADVTDIRQYTLENQPRDIQILGLSVLQGNDGKYDLGAKVFNPNERWYVTFTYSFLGNGFVGEQYKGFILPGDEKFVFDLNVEADVNPAQPRLDIRDIKWERIQDYASIRDEALRFEIENTTFSSARSSGLTNEKLISTSEFDVQNKSPFNFSEVTFITLLYSGSRIVGMNRLTQQNFMSGESRHVSQNWFGAIPSANRIEVFADVNILDDSVYLGFQ